MFVILFRVTLSEQIAPLDAAWQKQGGLNNPEMLRKRKKRIIKKKRRSYKNPVTFLKFPR